MKHSIYRLIVATMPQLTLVLLLNTNLYAQEMRFPSATIFKVESCGNTAQECYQKAQNELCQKKYQKAVTCFTEAITKKYTPLENAYYYRGIAQSNLCKSPKIGISVFGESKDACYNKAIDDFNQAIKLNRNYTDAYYQCGMAKSALGKYELAINDYTAAIKIKPDFANAYYQRGMAKSALGKYELAINDYTATIKIKPDFADAYYQRGNAYKVLEKHELSVYDYTQATTINKEFADAYYHIGVIRQEQKKYDIAFSNYENAIKYKPNFAEAYCGRGSIYASVMNINKKAFEDYDKAIQLNPNLAQAYYLRGSLFDKLEEYDKAVADYSTAIEKNADFKEAYLGRATINEKLGEYAHTTVGDYTNIIRLEPSFIDAYFHRIAAKEALGFYAEIVDDCNAVLNKIRDSKLNVTTKQHADFLNTRGWAYYNSRCNMCLEWAKLDYQKAKKVGGQQYVPEKEYWQQTLEGLQHPLPPKKDSLLVIPSRPDRELVWYKELVWYIYKEIIPSFTIPPPAASATHVLDTAIFRGCPTLGSAAQKITEPLNRQDYYEKSFYRLVDKDGTTIDGFAVVAKLEQIDPPTAIPLQPPNRWTIQLKPINTFTDYLESLFYTREGYFRIIVFVVTNQPLTQNKSRNMGRDDAMNLPSSGADVLPPLIANKQWTSEYHCTALIYEFKATENTPLQLVLPSNHSGMDHLRAAKLFLR